MIVYELLSDLKYRMMVKVVGRTTDEEHARFCIKCYPELIKTRLGKRTVSYWYIRKQYRRTKKGKLKLDKDNPFILVIELDDDEPIEIESPLGKWVKDTFL